MCQCTRHLFTLQVFHQTECLLVFCLPKGIEPNLLCLIYLIVCSNRSVSLTFFINFPKAEMLCQAVAMLVNLSISLPLNRMPTQLYLLCKFFQKYGVCFVNTACLICNLRLNNQRQLSHSYIFFLLFKSTVLFLIY